MYIPPVGKVPYKHIKSSSYKQQEDKRKEREKEDGFKKVLDNEMKRHN